LLARNSAFFSSALKGVSGFLRMSYSLKLKYGTGTSDWKDVVLEEAINTPFCPLQEKFHTLFYGVSEIFLRPRKIPL
jgi:hypothetical protein